MTARPISPTSANSVLMFRTSIFKIGNRTVYTEVSTARLGTNVRARIHQCSLNTLVASRTADDGWSLWASITSITATGSYPNGTGAFVLKLTF